MTKKNTKICCPGGSNEKTLKISNADEKRKVLATMTKAIAHPIRIKILDILKSRQSCVCGELVDALPIAQATVSQHLKVLKNAGFIRGEINGPAICYCLEPTAMKIFKELVHAL